MNADEIRARIDQIHRHLADHDNEAATATENELHTDTLRAIAAGAPNPADLAGAALATLGIHFNRY